MGQGQPLEGGDVCDGIWNLFQLIEVQGEFHQCPVVGQMTNFRRDGRQPGLDDAQGQQVVKMLNVGRERGETCFEAVVLGNVDVFLLGGADEKKFVGVAVVLWSGSRCFQ